MDKLRYVGITTVSGITSLLCFKTKLFGPQILMKSPNSSSSSVEGNSRSTMIPSIMMRIFQKEHESSMDYGFFSLQHSLGEDVPQTPLNPDLDSASIVQSSRLAFSGSEDNRESGDEDKDTEYNLELRRKLRVSQAGEKEKESRLEYADF